MRKTSWKEVLTGFCIAATLGGCSGSVPSTQISDTAPAGGKSLEPVTLTFAVHSAQMSKVMFEKYVAEPVKRKYPHITVNYVDIAVKGQSFPELVAAKQIPDLFTHSELNLEPLLTAKLDLNMEELIAKQQFDLKRIQPVFLDAVKIATFRDYLVGLPINNDIFGLFYNKTLFDRFGVPYPKDGMTWEEVRKLAERMTRMVDGVQYYGLHPDNVFRGAYQLSLPWIDVENDRAVFQTEAWHDLFRMWLSLFKSTGGPVVAKDLNVINGFTTGQIAIVSGYTATMEQFAKASALDWDVVTYPTNPSAPGIAQRTVSLVMTIPNQSKHKEEAFQVISTVLSDEVQTELSRNAMMSVLDNRAIQDQFGQAITAYQSKNLAVLTRAKFAKIQPFKYPLNPNPASLINRFFYTVVYDGVDINTALHDADEEMNKNIQEYLRNKKQ